MVFFLKEYQKERRIMDKKKSKGIIIRQLGAKCFRRKTKRNRK